MSGSDEAVPPAADCNRSVGTRRVARPLKDGREEPIAVFFSRGVLAAGVTALEGLTGKHAPGNGAATA